MRAPEEEPEEEEEEEEAGSMLSLKGEKLKGTHETPQAEAR